MRKGSPKHVFGLILILGVITASGVFFFSDGKQSEAAFDSKFIEQIGAGFIAPACGSSSVDNDFICNADGTVTARIHWYPEKFLIQTECNDLQDNDDDLGSFGGGIDFISNGVSPTDSACVSLRDNSEALPGEQLNTQCNDNIDNDGDGLIDYPNDPGCQAGYGVNLEASDKPQCSDTIDNPGTDIDGNPIYNNLIDYPQDPGCASANDNVEYDATDVGTLACSDGLDNDGNTLTDYPADPGCASASDPREWNPTSWCKYVNFFADSQVSDGRFNFYLGQGTPCYLGPTEGFLWPPVPQNSSQSYRVYASDDPTAGGGHLFNEGNVFGIVSFTTPICPAPNNAPVANATISTDGANYSDSVTVMQGVPTRIYLAASSAAGVSTDPDGWSDVTDNGKCEWNADLNQGAPTFEAPQAVNNPAGPASCNKSNVQLDVYDGSPDGFLTFNDAPGLKTYQVLRINDGTGDSNVDTVQVNVTAQPPPTVDMVAKSDPGGSYSDGPIYVNYGGTATLKWCKPSPVASPPIACAYAVSCTASGAWSGAKSPSGGTQSTGPLTAPATYTLACLNSLGVSRQDSVQIKIPDFILSANPPTIFATIKGSGSVTSSNSIISVTPDPGFNSTVSFSATLPSGLTGATANFLPTSLSSPYSSGSTFNVTVPANIAEGVYTITITGSGGGLPARTTTVTLNVAIKDPGFRETLTPIFEAFANASL